MGIFLRISMKLAENLFFCKFHTNSQKHPYVIHDFLVVVFITHTHHFSFVLLQPPQIAALAPCHCRCGSSPLSSDVKHQEPPMLSFLSDVPEGQETHCLRRTKAPLHLWSLLQQTILPKKAGRIKKKVGQRWMAEKTYGLVEQK